MARLVDVSQQQRPVARVPGRVGAAPLARAVAVDSTGPGFRALGQSLVQGGEEIYRAQVAEEDRINTTRAEEAYNDLLAQKSEFTAGGDGFTQLKGADAVRKPVFDDYSRRFLDAQRNIAETLSNDEQRRLFVRRADVAQIQYKEDLLRHLSSEGVAYQKEAYENTILFELQNAAADWAKPQRVEGSLARIRATIDRRADEEGWTAEQRAVETRVQVSKVRSSVAQSMMGAAPLAARRYMDRYQDEIDPRNFAVLRKQYVSELDRYDRLSDKRLKESQDLHENTLLLSVLGAGEIPVDDAVLNNALDSGQIRREQFERLRKAMAGEGAIDDPEAVMRLDDMAASGDPNTRDQISAAIAGKDIKPDTGAQIFRRFLQSDEQGGPLARSDVRRARSFVDKVIGGVRGPLAILDSASSERVARASAEFDRRIVSALQDNPDADPMAIAEDVAERYRLAPPTPSAFPRPKYLVGTRSKPDIAASRNATLIAFESGEIGREEAARELENLERIAASLAEREERK